MSETFIRATETLKRCIEKLEQLSEEPEYPQTVIITMPMVDYLPDYQDIDEAVRELSKEAHVVASIRAENGQNERLWQITTEKVDSVLLFKLSL